VLWAAKLELITNGVSKKDTLDTDLIRDLKMSTIGSFFYSLFSKFDKDLQANDSNSINSITFNIFNNKLTSMVLKHLPTLWNLS
jgi:hypothetical protein